MSSLSSTILHKLLLASTGLFLCVFLVVHLVANLQLLLPMPDAQLAYNNVAHTLESLPLIELLSGGLMLSILAHAVVGLRIELRNRKAASKYHGKADSATSPWYARQMALLGSLVLIFLVIHVRDFVYVFKFTDTVGLDANGNRDLYTLVAEAFGCLTYTLLYMACVVALGFHLLHGFFSAFKSLGLARKKTYPLLIGLGRIYAAVITVGFLAICVVMHMRAGA